MQHLTIEQAQYIAHQLAIDLMDYTDEPIPPFETRYPHILESCLEQPFQSFGGKELYQGLYLKAALMFYLVIKNHPFRNGNKRMAVMLTLTFLYLNGAMLNITNNDLYDIALDVARSDKNRQKEIVNALCVTFKSFGGPNDIFTGNQKGQI